MSKNYFFDRSSSMSKNPLRFLWEKHLESTIQLNFKANDQPRYVTYRSPGLNYFTDYDRNGLPNLVRLMLYSVFAESLANRMPCSMDNGELSTFMYWDRLLKDRTSFVASTELKFSRALYSKDIPKWPLNVKAGFGGMGTTSILTKTEFFTEFSQEPIITKVTKLVLVDIKTRRPLTLPDWFIDSLKGKEEEMPDFKFTGFEKPTSTYIRQVQIVWSHTDTNNHTNFSSYVLFGLDSLHLFLAEKGQAQGELCHKHESRSLAAGPGISPRTQMGPAAAICKAGVSPVLWITEEVVRNGVRNLKICYMKESLEGDLVNVHIWQEPGEELKLRCSVEAADGDTLCQFVLEYFPPSSSL